MALSRKKEGSGASTRDGNHVQVIHAREYTPFGYRRLPVRDRLREMNTCHWCGDQHGLTALCQRAQRGLTRRSFCFLFGAGVAGAMLAPELAQTTEGANFSTRVYFEGLNKKMFEGGGNNILA